MNISDLTAFAQVLTQARENKALDERVISAMNLVGQGVADLVAYFEEDRADDAAEKPAKEAKHAATMAALAGLTRTLEALPQALREALASVAQQQQTPVPLPDKGWTRIQVGNIETDRMGRMQSFTVEKVA